MIQRLHFAHLPTPIEELPRLTKYLGGPRLLVKRDDQTGLAFGGNKTRKLEFLVAEAQAQGARTLISAGAIQSNHCRQTAAVAARFGLECTLVLTGDLPAQPSANLMLDEIFGAEIVHVPDRTDRERILQETYETAVQSGKKPYLVPYGGSSPVGALGYAFAMEELMKQKPCEGFSPSTPAEGEPSQGCPDWILFATSSGGTHAGLTLGKRLFGFAGKILGISIDESEAWLKSHVSALASEASALVGERIEFAPGDVMATDAYCRAGYGVLTDAEREALQLFARYEGLLLDPVYTGRAAAGLIDLIRKGWFDKGETVLFWHTGGQPALFADTYSPLLG
jgi:D-cysteine desulfhydrase